MPVSPGVRSFDERKLRRLADSNGRPGLRVGPAFRFRADAHRDPTWHHRSNPYSLSGAARAFVIRLWHKIHPPTDSGCLNPPDVAAFGMPSPWTIKRNRSEQCVLRPTQLTQAAIIRGSRQRNFFFEEKAVLKHYNLVGHSGVREHGNPTNDDF